MLRKWRHAFFENVVAQSTNLEGAQLSGWSNYNSVFNSYNKFIHSRNVAFGFVLGTGHNNSLVCMSICVPALLRIMYGVHGVHGVYMVEFTFYSLVEITDNHRLLGLSGYPDDVTHLMVFFSGSLGSFDRCQSIKRRTNESWKRNI